MARQKKMDIRKMEGVEIANPIYDVVSSISWRMCLWQVISLKRLSARRLSISPCFQRKARCSGGFG